MAKRGNSRLHPSLVLLILLASLICSSISEPEEWLSGNFYTLLDKGTETSDPTHHICKLMETNRMDQIRLLSFTFKVIKEKKSGLGYLPSLWAAKTYYLWSFDYFQRIQLKLFVGDEEQYRYAMDMDDIDVVSNTLKLPEKTAKLDKGDGIIRAGYYIHLSEDTRSLVLDNVNFYVDDPLPDFKRYLEGRISAPKENFSLVQDYFNPQSRFYVFSQDFFKVTSYPIIYPLRFSSVHCYDGSSDNGAWDFCDANLTKKFKGAAWHNIGHRLDSTPYFYVLKTEQPDKVLFLHKNFSNDLPPEEYRLFQEGMPQAGFIHKSRMYLFDSQLHCVYIVVDWDLPDLSKTSDRHDRFTKTRINVPYEKFFKCSSSLAGVDKAKYPSDRCETKATVPAPIPDSPKDKEGVVTSSIIRSRRKFPYWAVILAVVILVVAFVAVFFFIKKRKSGIRGELTAANKQKGELKGKTLAVGGKQGSTGGSATGKSHDGSKSSSKQSTSSKSKSTSKKKAN